MSKNYFKSLYAGILIGIAALAYLSNTNQIVGALLFSFGLLIIVNRGYNLYTGKVGYLFEDKSNFKMILITLLGNISGTFLVGLMAKTALPNLVDKADSLVEYKFTLPFIEVLILSILCGMMMYLAVDGHKKAKNDVSKVVIVIMAVMIFILAKFEHSVANMVYLSISTVFNFEIFYLLLTMIVGNGIGAILLNTIDHYLKEENN